MEQHPQVCCLLEYDAEKWVDGHRRFGETCCFHLGAIKLKTQQVWCLDCKKWDLQCVCAVSRKTYITCRWKQYFCRKLVHGVISKKMVIFIGTSFRTSALTDRNISSLTQTTRHLFEAMLWNSERSWLGSDIPFHSDLTKLLIQKFSLLKISV